MDVHNHGKPKPNDYVMLAVMFMICATIIAVVSIIFGG